MIGISDIQVEVKSYDDKNYIFQCWWGNSTQLAKSNGVGQLLANKRIFLTVTIKPHIEINNKFMWISETVIAVSLMLIHILLKMVTADSLLKLLFLQRLEWCV